MFANTVLEYPILTIISIGKKSFEAMGKVINRSGDTVKRRLRLVEESFRLTHKIAGEIFKDKNKLIAIIDDTLIKKFFSRVMRGAGLFYDTKLSRLVMAYRLLVIAISDGRHTIPIKCTFLFTKELLEEPTESKTELAKRFFIFIEKLFPNKYFIFFADVNVNSI